MKIKLRNQAAKEKVESAKLSEANNNTVQRDAFRLAKVLEPVFIRNLT